MRIAIDFPWDASAHMGTGAYSETMVRALASAAPESQIVLIVPPGAHTSIQMDNVSFHNAPSVGLPGEGYRQVGLPAILENLDADILFAPATLLPVVKPCPMVATVHDVTHLDHPEFYSPGLVDYLNCWFEPSLRAADGILAISEEAKSALVRRIPWAANKVTVLLQPVREEFTRLLSEDQISKELNRLGVQRPFFFHVSNLAPHKNIPFVIEAFAHFMDRKSGDWSLVLAGGANAPNRQPDLRSCAERHGVHARLNFLGRVEDRSLLALYQGCEAFLFPSLAEGWGLPVAEARAAGCRVIASPHVPAAAEAQRVPIQVDLWANAMFDHEFGRAEPLSITLPDTGRKLLESLESMVRRRSKASGLAVPSAANSEPKSFDAEGSLELRVGYRGDWYSPSGYGEAARATYEALLAGGLECRAVSAVKDAIQMRELFSREVSTGPIDADVWIHHLPPDRFQLELPGFHVAPFAWEADRLEEGSAWVALLNRIDQIWAPSEFLKDVLSRSGVTTPSHVVPHPIDTHLFRPGARRWNLFNFPKGFDPTWTVFLYVGTWDTRKRPDILVRAFSKAFGQRQKALLVMKSYVTGDAKKDTSILHDWVAKCRSGGAHIVTVPEILPRSAMVELFRLATAFVTASRGEGYCLPGVTAMSCGAPVIAHGWSAFADYAQIPVRYRLAEIPGDLRLPGYAPGMRWAEIDEDDLAAKLVWAHENRKDMGILSRQARRWVEQNASIERVGPMIRGHLRELCHAPR